MSMPFRSATRVVPDSVSATHWDSTKDRPRDDVRVKNQASELVQAVGRIKARNEPERDALAGIEVLARDLQRLLEKFSAVRDATP